MVEVLWAARPGFLVQEAGFSRGFDRFEAGSAGRREVERSPRVRPPLEAVFSRALGYID
ncbi:MAG: hypothetical protein IH936_08945 [Acidobacteria bacterium]|nr:hypothetical protein [Acidobacteriota bacterium]